MNTHQMKLQPFPYLAMHRGDKTVEMRLFDEKRQTIAVGDTLVFTQTETGETLTVQVVALRRYADFEALYASEAHTTLGYAPHEVAHPSDMSQYYPPEEIQRYGVLAIEIRRISQ